jgi:transposase-like protein
MNHGLRGAGNLVKAGTYLLKASGEKKQMLKCTVCGTCFSETQNDLFAGYHYGRQTIRDIIVSVADGNGIRATARKLGVSKDRVNNIVLKAGRHADMALSNLCHSLHLKEEQIDKLLLFVQRNTPRKR